MVQGQPWARDRSDLRRQRLPSKKKKDTDPAHEKTTKRKDEKRKKKRVARKGGAVRLDPEKKKGNWGNGPAKG